MAKELSKEQVDKLLKKLHEGEYSLFNLPEEIFLLNFDEIFNAVKEGFGATTTTLREDRLVNYKGNVAIFSGAKTYQEVKDISMFMFLDDGSKRPWKEFREFAININEQYNVNWLRTERDTAFAMAQGADQWLINEEEAEDFPLLQYDAVDDARTRPEHDAWDGIIKPVNDPFWDTRMPPNGFNCRCRTRQLSEGKETNLKEHLKKVNKQFKKEGIEPLKSLKNTDKMFSVNPGKVDYIFDEKVHPYFKIEKRFKPMLKNNFGFKTP